MIEYSKENEKRLASITAFTVRPLHNRHNPFTLLHKIMNNSIESHGKVWNIEESNRILPNITKYFAFED